MASHIHGTLHFTIDCTKLDDAERARVVKRLEDAHGHGKSGAFIHDALEGLVLEDVKQNNPDLLDKWVGLETGPLGLK